MKNDDQNWIKRAIIVLRQTPWGILKASIANHVVNLDLITFLLGGFMQCKFPPEGSDL
jgi:hypothetical protein